MYKLTVISQPFVEQNTTDTKQHENCESFREYNSVVFNTPILHIIIFLHICNLLMQHLQVTYIYLHKSDYVCFLRFPGSEMEEVSFIWSGKSPLPVISCTSEVLGNFYI